MLRITHVLQETLERGQEARLVQLDFSAAFDRVNHLGLLFKLRAVGVGGSVLSVLTEFLSSRSQRVLVDGVQSSEVLLVSGVPQGSVLGPLLFLVYTSELFDILENDLVGYADDSTLLAVVPSPEDRVIVSQSFDRDLARIQSWCNQWAMQLNIQKSKSMIVSRSRTIRPSFPVLLLHGVALEESTSLRILGVTLDPKLTFECHLREVSRSAFSKLGIMRRSWRIFRDTSLLKKCFNTFVLPVLEYCSSVWCSAASSHLRLLERVVTSAKFLVSGELDCDLEHRRSVAALCMLYKVWSNPIHSLNPFLPPPYQPGRITRGAVAAHQYSLSAVRCRTVQYGRTFLPWTVQLWNELDGDVFDGGGLESFKCRVNRFLSS